MTHVVSQPSFWLDVKKEYVIENFESLLCYLRDYNYRERDEKPNGDFSRTFNCLKAVVYDYIEESVEDNFFETPAIRWGDKAPFVVRVIAAYLLTCKTKKGVDDLRVLSKLADMLLLMGEASTAEMMVDIKSLICSCMMGRRVESLRFQWDDVMKSDGFSLNTFCYKVGKTSFSSETVTLPMHFEGNGLVVLEDDVVVVAPMNHASYVKPYKTLNTIIDDVVGVKVKAVDKMKYSTFAQLKDECNVILNSMANIGPSPKMLLKSYEGGDEVTVRVVSTSAMGCLEVESIDPAYNKVRGAVMLKSNYRGLSSREFVSYLEEGNFLRVTKLDNPTCPFILDKTFDSFYESFADGARGNVCSAIYSESYAYGHRWLTEEGLQVNIMGDTEAVREAIDTMTPILVHVTGSRIDRSNNFVLNGNYCDEAYEDEYYGVESFKTAAYRFLVSEFAGDSEPDNIPQQRVESKLIDEAYVTHLAHVIYYLAEDETDTMDRYKMLFVAAMLARIASKERDMAFVKFEMDYLTALVRFAQGDIEEVGSLGYHACLEGVPVVEEKRRIVAELCQYDNSHTSKIVLKRSDNEALSENIKGLVDASNILRGKINPSEINRIKKNIAGYLGVADMYQNICGDLTYYGEESDTLEFKTSMVYPPNSNMQPDPAKQKWAILKTICGFLNTITGGELLLGVDDNGNSCGLRADMDYLFHVGIIKDNSIDKYRNYIKNIVDRAFVDDSGIASNTEITATRINYIIEQSNEGYYVIRIKVSPYEYGIVSFATDDDRLPDGMSSSYYRTSGATLPMNAELKRQAREKKLSASLDQDARKVLDLQKSIKDEKIVVLKNYASQSGIGDRRVEIYQLLPDRNTVVGYDLVKKDIREFKVTRFEGVDILSENWKNKSKHKRLTIDVFDMLQNPGVAPMRIELKLKHRAYNLLVEEYSNAGTHIRKNEGADAKEYPYILDTMVNRIEGVGRFYLGLAREILIVDGDVLRDYAREYIKCI